MPFRPATAPAVEDPLARLGLKHVTVHINGPLEAALVEAAGHEVGPALAQVVTRALVWRVEVPGDFRKNNPRFQPEAMDANQALVERVKAVAARHDATPAQIALAWLLAQGEHIVPIPGTRRVERLEENAAAASLRLSAEDLAELDALPDAVGSRY